jgi:DNA-binding transcriptional ArsR family regulator
MNQTVGSSPEPRGDLHDLAEVDRVVHEPARLLIVTMLYAVESADFLFLLRESGLSKGNLSSHLSRLESAGHVAIEKTFRGKIATICLYRQRRQGSAPTGHLKRR